MVAFALFYLAVLVDPVLQVQLRYPTHRTTITTASGHVVAYSLPPDTPPELWRAYKVLEAAEREVLITEALQLLKLELVRNERRLEALRTTRLAAYLTDSRAAPQCASFDAALIAPPESRLKYCVSEILASDARIERGLAALDRFVEAHYQLRLALIAVAYPDRRPTFATKPAAPAPAVAVAVPARFVLAAAEKAEKVAAAAELTAEGRESDARSKERSAEARYRDAPPADRAAARAAWLVARDAWEQARRDWDEAREKWQAARDQLGALRKSAAATPPR